MICLQHYCKESETRSRANHGREMHDNRSYFVVQLDMCTDCKEGRPGGREKTVEEKQA